MVNAPRIGVTNNVTRLAPAHMSIMALLLASQGVRNHSSRCDFTVTIIIS